MAKIFDPSEFHIVFGGATMAGFAENSMAKFQFTSPSLTSKVGVDGEVSWSKNMDRRATLTVTLMSTSDTNDLLSAIYTAQRLGVNGGDIAALRVEDGNGRLVITGPEARLIDTPKPDYGKEATEYEWTIEIANCDAFFGGND